MDDLVAGSPYERVPEGPYVILVERAERGRGWTDRRTGRPKDVLYLRCLILSGSPAGTRLFMALSLNFKGQRPRPSSAFYEAWTVAMARKPVRGERMTLRAFVGKVFEAEVVTVTRDSLGRIRPIVTQYSRVARLLQLLGTREGYLLPHTEYHLPDTEYLIPPSPGDSATLSNGCAEMIPDGEAGVEPSEIQKQEKKPGGEVGTAARPLDAPPGGALTPSKNDDRNRAAATRVVAAVQLGPPWRPV